MEVSMKNNIYKNLKRIKAFTLVELLIVIGLLGAIALIVISAINPIEQSNRARDTRFKADGGQLISAIDRYFASRSEFPWMTGTLVAADDELDFVSAHTPSIGLCGTASCTGSAATSYGVLITSDELKQEFRDRDFIKNGATGSVDEKIMIGKGPGASSSIYACFIPLSKSIREKACNDGKVYTLAAGGVRTQITAADPTCAATSATWISAPQYICIPE